LDTIFGSHQTWMQLALAGIGIQPSKKTQPITRYQQQWKTGTGRTYTMQCTLITLYLMAKWSIVKSVCLWLCLQPCLDMHWA